ncbi:MAG: anhydro-N-acetylmuramic acid kinase [Saprospiraceae bacterium]
MSTHVIGIMSGSSLDGLDIALCQFEEKGNSLLWEIMDSTTIPYTDQWYDLLKSASNLSGRDLMHLDAYFGDFIGEQTKKLIDARGWKADYVASHGHTVFHEPALGFTTQIGSGAHISLMTGLDTITSFRNSDVAAGGQGAPFSPVADRTLFSGYEGFLNLGGIANVTLIDKNEIWHAWDICPCNQTLNFLSQRANLSFDKGGHMASQGAILDEISQQLIAMYPFDAGLPRGLSNAEVASTWISYLESRTENTHDLLGTTTQSIADVISIHISSLIKRPAKILVTGGGVYNDHLIKLLQKAGQDFGITYELPSPEIIDFKESLLIAYLGYLTMNGKPYNIHTLTGASQNMGGGALYKAV